MLCETGVLAGNLLSLESKMGPASSVAPRYYPVLKKPLEILSSICLSVRPSIKSSLVAFPIPILSEPQIRQALAF